MSPVELKASYLPPKKWEWFSFLRFFIKNKGHTQTGWTDGGHVYNPEGLPLRHMLLLWYSLIFIISAASMSFTSLVKAVSCSRARNIYFKPVMAQKKARLCTNFWYKIEVHILYELHFTIFSSSKKTTNLFQCQNLIKGSRQWFGRCK